MIAPTCSLFPGDGGRLPEDPPGGRGGRWQRAAVAVVVVALLLPVVLAYLSQVARLRAEEPAPPAGAATPEPRTPPGDGGAPEVPREAGQAPTQFSGADPLETTVEHAGGLMLVRVTHRGDGPFALHIGEGPRAAPDGAGPGPGTAGGAALVDVAGEYRGSRAIALPAGTYRLGVAAGGHWGLAIEQPSYTRTVTLPRTLEGVGDTATRPFEIGTARTVRMDWTVEHDGQDAAPAGTPLRVRVLDTAGAAVAELSVAGGERVEQHLGAGRYVLDVSTDAGVWRVLLS